MMTLIVIAIIISVAFGLVTALMKLASTVIRDIEKEENEKIER